MDESENSSDAKAKTIETKCKELQKQCKDPEQRKGIKVTEVILIMEFIAAKLTENHGHLFEVGFLGHLQIISELVIDESIEFVDHFTKITKLMCEMCLKTELRLRFIDSLLIQWFKCVRKSPITLKLAVFDELKSTEFKKCAQFITVAQCISSKVQMFNILCSYLQNDSDPLVKLSSLFENIVEQHTLDIIQSTEWETDGTSLQSKLWILERINHWQRAIHSELVDSMEFGTAVKIPFERNEGRLYFNKFAKTIEFWLGYKSKTVLFTISARRMKNVQVLESEKYFAQNLKLILNEPPRLETANGRTIDLLEFQVTTINVKFDTGIYRERLDAMLMEMFGITPEVIRTNNNVDTDSDVEIIGVTYEHFVIERSRRSSSYAKGSVTKQSDTKRSNTNQSAAKRKIPMQSDTKKQTVSTTHQRPQRTAAKKANEGISKCLEGYSNYESSADSRGQTDRKQKIKNAPQLTTSRWVNLASKKEEIGATNGRKLRSKEQNQISNKEQADNKDKNRIERRLNCVDNVELTPIGFRDSKQESQNQNDKEIAEPTYSYKIYATKNESKRAKNSAKTFNSTCDSKKLKLQEDDFTQTMDGQENKDINANEKPCSCQQLEMELKNINKWSRQALLTLRSNEYTCTKCSGMQQTN